jgi:hypothetical protein
MKQTQTVRGIMRGLRSEDGQLFPVDSFPLVCAGYVHRSLLAALGENAALSGLVSGFPCSAAGEPVTRTDDLRATAQRRVKFFVIDKLTVQRIY